MLINRFGYVFLVSPSLIYLHYDKVNQAKFIHVGLLSFLSVLICCSCTHFYQVAYVTSDNLVPKRTGYVFENDTVKISYFFWSEKGILDYSVYNKLSVPLYIDWKKSAYIRNSVKNDYWKDSEISNSSTVTRAGATGVSNGRVGVMVSRGESETTSITNKPERITFIAPKSEHKNSTFVIGRRNGINITDTIKSVTLKRLDKDGKVTSGLVEEFSRDNTPINFRVFLTLSTKENFSDEFYIDNGFFLAKVIQMTGKQFAKYKGYESYYYNEMRYYTKLDRE